MKLSDQKDALFGNAPMPKAAAKSTSTTSSTVKPANSGLSQQTKDKKIAEAREHAERAEKHLQTSLFKWSADHLAAAPAFEQAANAYRVAGELDLCREMFVKAAVSHQKYGADAAGALTFMKAAQVAHQAGQLNLAGDLYQQAAATWGISGEVDKAGDSYAKAAKELESVSPDTAMELYLRALDLLCPSDLPEDQIKYTKPITTDVFRAAFVFALSLPQFSNTALNLARRMIVYYRGVEQDVSMCRSMLAITLLLLKAGDVVAADQQFLQDLSVSSYLHSAECRLAEAFLIAFKNYDLDALDAAQRSPDLHHQEREVIAFAKQLSLMTSHNKPEPEQYTAPAEEESAAAAAVNEEEDAMAAYEAEMAAAEKQSLPEEQEEEDEIDLT